MFCELYYDLFRGYKANQKIDINFLSPNTSHITILVSANSMKFRKYTSLYDFEVQNINSIEICYNITTDKYLCEKFSPFRTLDFGEFVHMHLPKERFQIYQVSVENYINNTMKLHHYDYFVPDENYMCKCGNSNRECVYHEFITEKLYIKYIKNDCITENSDICNDDDNVWSMV